MLDKMEVLVGLLLRRTGSGNVLLNQMLFFRPRWLLLFSALIFRITITTLEEWNKGAVKGIRKEEDWFKLLEQNIIYYCRCHLSLV